MNNKSDMLIHLFSVLPMHISSYGRSELKSECANYFTTNIFGAISVIESRSAISKAVIVTGDYKFGNGVSIISVDREMKELDKIKLKKQGFIITV